MPNHLYIYVHFTLSTTKYVPVSCVVQQQQCIFEICIEKVTLHMIFQASSNKSASARMTTSSEFVCVHVQFFVLLSEELTLGDSTNRVYGILMWDQGERIMGTWGRGVSIGASNLAQESAPLQYWAYERKLNFCKNQIISL